jgi:hypothetical protein
MEIVFFFSNTFTCGMLNQLPVNQSLYPLTELRLIDLWVFPAQLANNFVGV